jgi:hypothetical protein
MEISNLEIKIYTIFQINNILIHLYTKQILIKLYLIFSLYKFELNYLYIFFTNSKF